MTHATEQQINHVKSWGFQEFAKGAFKRNALKGHTEYWSVSRPDYIDFADADDQFTEDYKIDWAVFTK